VPLTSAQYRGEVSSATAARRVIGGIFQINDQDQNKHDPGPLEDPAPGQSLQEQDRTEKHDELSDLRPPPTDSEVIGEAK
jgi:hypothetical protein